MTMVEVSTHCNMRCLLAPWDICVRRLVDRLRHLALGQQLCSAAGSSSHHRTLLRWWLWHYAGLHR